MTTSIGLVSATAQYFTKMSNGKVKYETIVVGVCIFSALVANFGVSAIIKFASPILTVIYPATIVLVLMTLFNNKIKNDNTFKGATYVALIISILTVIDNMGVNVFFIEHLPFYKLGFNWIIPTIIGGIIGSLIKQKEKQEIN
ncbi:branched-chain amino acid transport family protein [[Clostridium] sordellii ATCC 9714]|nr:branched-chain amino acid transport family protein [[Clostridium] sordellii ATCC 9714] [Paeniclostridium sordellii ATCC 9714]